MCTKNDKYLQIYDRMIWKALGLLRRYQSRDYDTLLDL